MRIVLVVVSSVMCQLVLEVAEAQLVGNNDGLPGAGQGSGNIRSPGSLPIGSSGFGFENNSGIVPGEFRNGSENSTRRFFERWHNNTGRSVIGKYNDTDEFLDETLNDTNIFSKTLKNYTDPIYPMRNSTSVPAAQSTGYAGLFENKTNGPREPQSSFNRFPDDRRINILTAQPTIRSSGLAWNGSGYYTGTPRNNASEFVQESKNDTVRGNIAMKTSLFSEIDWRRVTRDSTRNPANVSEEISTTFGIGIALHPEFPGSGGARNDTRGDSGRPDRNRIVVGLSSNVTMAGSNVFPTSDVNPLDSIFGRLGGVTDGLFNHPKQKKTGQFSVIPWNGVSRYPENQGSNSTAFPFGLRNDSDKLSIEPGIGVRKFTKGPKNLLLSEVSSNTTTLESHNDPKTISSGREQFWLFRQNVNGSIAQFVEGHQTATGGMVTNGITQGLVSWTGKFPGRSINGSFDFPVKSLYGVNGFPVEIRNDSSIFSNTTARTTMGRSEGILNKWISSGLQRFRKSLSL